MSRLLLASASPRRAKILHELGLAFEVVVPETDEVLWADDPRGTAEHNAQLKLDWCRARYPRQAMLAADTVIDFEGRCVTKPQSRAQAVAFLEQFSGGTQTVITAVALARPEQQPTVERSETIVRFRPLEAERIAEYLARVDPMDKAGAYDIDQAGELIIEEIRGSRTNVMGLPREVVERWVRRSARRDSE